MFKSLLGSVTSVARSVRPSPHELSVIALAFARYQDTGDFLIDDSYLESRLAKALDGGTDVTDFALFGMKDHLRLVACGVWKGQEVEATISIQPVAVHWGPFFRFVFDVTVLRWEVHGRPAKLAGMALRRAVASLLPLGGLLNIIGQAAIHKAVSSAGIAKLAACDELSERGVSWEGNRATLDLTAQPELAGFFTVHGGGFATAMAALGMNSSMASQFKVTDLAVERSGLVLHVTLSPAVHTTFSTAAQAFKLLQTSSHALQNQLPSQA